MNHDKPTAAERLASTQPGCTCAVHCQHVHGDQAADPLEHENDRFKGELRKALVEIGRLNDDLNHLRSAHAAENAVIQSALRVAVLWFVDHDLTDEMPDILKPILRAAEARAAAIRARGAQ